MEVRHVRFTMFIIFGNAHEGNGVVYPGTSCVIVCMSE
jgi:hypothetical protein